MERDGVHQDIPTKTFYLSSAQKLFTFGLVLWHINHCSLFNAKPTLYIYIKYIEFCLVGFYGISTIVDYLIPNPLYTYILNIYVLVWFGLVWFYGISTIVDYLIPNPLYIYICMFWFGWVYGISTIVGYLMPNPLYTYIYSKSDLLMHCVDNIFEWAGAHFFARS